MINLICVGFFFPVMNLPVALYVKKDLGIVNFCIQAALCLIILVKLLNRQHTFSKYHIACFFLLVTLCIYGGIIGWNKVNLIVIILGAKFLILPLILCSVYLLNEREVDRIIQFSFLVQIANFIAVLAEISIGQEQLLRLGFDYGTNIRNFSGSTRYPGITLANYELGVYSAVVFSIALLAFTNKAFRFGVSRGYLRIVMLSSFGCLFGSSLRSGMVFVLVFWLSYMLIVQKNFSSSLMFLVISISAILFAFMNNNLFVDFSSSKSRLELWSGLLSDSNFWYGAGLGTSGSASHSTYAGLGNRIFTDNQLIGFILQFGFLGFVGYILLFFTLMRASVKETYPLVVAFFITSNFLEIWDYTVFMSLMYLVIFRLRIQKSCHGETHLLP